jgi:hypothetical protein
MNHRDRGDRGGGRNEANNPAWLQHRVASFWRSWLCSVISSGLPPRPPRSLRFNPDPLARHCLCGSETPLGPDSWNGVVATSSGFVSSLRCRCSPLPTEVGRGVCAPIDSWLTGARTSVGNGVNRITCRNEANNPAWLQHRVASFWRSWLRSVISTLPPPRPPRSLRFNPDALAR